MSRLVHPAAGHAGRAFIGPGRNCRSHEGPRFDPELSIGSMEYDTGTIEDFGVHISLPQETVVRTASQTRDLSDALRQAI